MQFCSDANIFLYQRRNIVGCIEKRKYCQIVINNKSRAIKTGTQRKLTNCQINKMDRNLSNKKKKKKEKEFNF